MLENNSIDDIQNFSLSAEGPEKKEKRKLQLSNGYSLDFSHLSRVIASISKKEPLPRISRKVLQDDTGLPDRHIESIISIGTAMGILKRGSQTLTKVGRLIADFDTFFERPGTLEWCHYKGAGSVRNLVWFDVFNRLLVEEEPMGHTGWNAWFRKNLAGQYSERTLRKVVQEEVHFIIDAYLEDGFTALKLLTLGEGNILTPQRHRHIDRLIFAAMLYDFIKSQQGRTFEVAELTRKPGSPALVFALDVDSVRTLLEGLHTAGLLRYETTHNLDQIRLIPGYEALEFLRAYYKGGLPHRNETEESIRG